MKAVQTVLQDGPVVKVAAIPLSAVFCCNEFAPLCMVIGLLGFGAGTHASEVAEFL